MHTSALRGRIQGRAGVQLIALDVLAAVAYTVVTVLITVTPALPEAPRLPVPAWAATLLVAAMGLPAAVRRLWPLPVFAVVLSASVVSVLLGVIRDPFVASAFAIYTVALAGPGRWWAPAVALGSVGLAGVLAAFRVASSYSVLQDLGWTLLGAVVVGGSWTLGVAVRDRRAAGVALIRQVTRQAVTDERLRIARELHDVVAHSMSLIAVKAGVANHVLGERPEEAQDALQVIEATSRSALVEMRHLLGVLRTGTDEGEALEPAPGIAALPELTERAAMADVRVEMDVRGVDHLPEGVGVSVYRIVQEALTNVVKHAAPARCRVTVEAAGGVVRIDVTDDGAGHRTPPGRPADMSGHGLVGMRERVALYGGAFAAGPRPEGGFAVSARFPYRGEAH